MKKFLFILVTTVFLAGFTFIISLSIHTEQVSPDRMVNTTVLLSNTQTPEAEPPQLKIPDPNETVWIPVIVYHHIAPVPKKGTSATKSLFIEAEWFEKHLQYLQDNGFTVIHFSDIAEYFSNGTPLPDRPVLINFDDGWKNMIENAFPILQKYGITATVFPVVHLVGHGNRLDWHDLETLRDAEFEIGSHTLWHPYLSKSRKARAEIFDSKRILEEKMGIPITTFAYPFGDWNSALENLVKEAGYTTGRSFTTGNGISGENLFHIPVVRVYANVGLDRWKNQLFPP